MYADGIRSSENKRSEGRLIVGYKNSNGWCDNECPFFVEGIDRNHPMVGMVAPERRNDVYAINDGNTKHRLNENGYVGQCLHHCCVLMSLQVSVHE